MTHFRKAFLSIMCICMCASSQASPVPGSFSELAKKVMPAVVNISTTQIIKNESFKQPGLPGTGSPIEELFREFLERNQRPRKVRSLGSGFVIDPKGFIVTNSHVVAEADKITIHMTDGTEYEAKVIGRDRRADLALIKIDPQKPLPFVQWGDSDKPEIGDWVMAVGNPFGFNSTVTVGIISTRARDILSPDGNSFVDDYIQTDAAINMGNSGGPMFDMDGNVIGVNTAIASPSGGSVGIGFAVPANIAKQSIDQLIKYGKVKHGWIGVRIQEVNKEIAQTLKLPKPMGALIASVSPGGPAEKAGIQAGDVILSFNGKAVQNSNRLPRIVSQNPIGSSVPVEIWRNGKKLTVKITLGDFVQAEKEGIVSTGPGTEPKSDVKNHLNDLGIELTNIDPQMRLRFKIDEKVKGALISGVKRSSPAGERGVRPGDVIISVNQRFVRNAEEASALITAARKHKGAAVLLNIVRGSDSYFVALRFEEDALK